ncbi:SCO family protein [Candidatus Magnetomonas plexicatena]|uniref:SCO family protein n=1 Tax=Candidatus Magnetomonas plexicatena TaxID=2552947 RepID=UPI001C73F68F|nr:SCO family protein [Nitrospirales bacterium LBB_01]
MRILFLILLLLIAAPVESFAPSAGNSTFDAQSLKINEDDYLGKSVPDIAFTDERGTQYKLSDFAGKPLILSIVYYTCYQSCPILNEGLSTALSKIDMKLGKDYNVITLSFDHKENAALAAQFRKNLDVKMKGDIPANFEKWIFAVSAERDIKALTDSVGYRFFFSTEDKMFVHPNVYVFLSPDRKITRYLFGLYPSSFDIKIALLESAKGKVGKFPLVSVVALACYKYDAATGVYRLNLPVIFASIGFSLGALTGLIVFLYSRNLKKKKGLIISR